MQSVEQLRSSRRSRAGPAVDDRQARWAGRSGAPARADAGVAAISYTVTIALTMVLFVLCANVIVALYVRGVVRGALDEGARAGSRTLAGAAECQQRAEEAVDQLLAGRMRAGVAIQCAETPTAVTASATATFPGWLPGIPALTFDLGATAVREQRAETS